MASVINEHTQFYDASTGLPLNAGFLYIGTVDTDAKLNAITIYSDRELTTSISNPQTLDSSGRSTNKIYVPGRYSMKVENSNNVQKYDNLDNGEDASADVVALSSVQGTNTITATASPTISAYVNNATYVFITANAPTGATTLNIDNVGAKSILKRNDVAIITGDIEASQVVVVVYNSADDVFEMTSQLAKAGTVTTQIFTASGTYTLPSGVLFAMVEVQAGGGAGGGAAGTNATQAAAGAGGGGGGYARELLSAATIGASQTTTIGAGGTGGTGDGGAGGTTSFGSLLSASGGSGGVAMSATAAFDGSVGGAGGVGSGGDVNVSGGAGGGAFAIGETDTATAKGSSGIGGSAHLGGGAVSRFTGTVQTGLTGGNYGGGGSGAAAGDDNAAADNGGAGAPGIIIVTEFYQ